METEIKFEVDEYHALLARIWKQPEGQKIDFKKPFVFDKKNKKKEAYSLVKDILAMANTDGGGYIVLGREDKGGRGIACESDVLSSFDPSNIQNLTKKYGRPAPQFSICQADSPENTQALIIVVKEFEEHPIICAKNAHDEKGNLILQEGDIYIRSKTGDAMSARVMSEQDMRCLIQRSILKSRVKYKDAFESDLTDFMHGRNSKSPLHDNSGIWMNKIAMLTEVLVDEVPLKRHILQIVAHPESYDEYLLRDGKTIKEMLLGSVDIHNGRSFPCPDFEINELHVFDKAGIEILETSRHYLEGKQRIAFSVDVSGLIIYREELSTYYDASTTPGKPLLVGVPLLVLYRALEFFGRFYRFVPATEYLKISIMITDTYNRYPATGVSIFNHLNAFYTDKPLPFAKIQSELKIERNELTTGQKLAYSKPFRRFFEGMGIKLTEEQLLAEVDNIAQRLS